MSYGGLEYGAGGFGGGGGFGGSPGGGGGGYMAAGAVDSPATGSGGPRNQDRQSVLPVNVKQVLESDMPSQDSSAKIDGVEVAQIKLVGCIVELEHASTNTEYTVEDTTGRLKVKVFHNDGDGMNDRSAERRSRTEIGTYVRLFGSVRSWNGDRHSVAYDMQPISDFNEVTMHCLEIIYCHLFNTKGPLPGKAARGGSVTSGGQPIQGLGSPGYGRSGQDAFGGNNGGFNYNGDVGGAMEMGGFTDVQQKVHDQFRGVTTEQGRSVDEVIRSLRPAGISPHDVQSAILFLSSEGHLYSTIDENHFRSTEG